MDYTQDFGFQQQQHDFGALSGSAELQQQQPRYHQDFEPSHAAMQDHSQNVYVMSQAGQKITCDVKPRLTKEQHDVLEAHYQKQQKPNTSAKRSFAEALNVSLEKVNNWFQNRRAKSKQDAKKQHGPVSIFSVPQPSQISLGASDSDTSPAFASADYLQMMHDEDDMFAYEQPQLMTVNADMNYLLPDMATQELNRRTLTQEQFDALEQQDILINPDDLAMLAAGPKSFKKFMSYNSQTGMPQGIHSGIAFDLTGVQQHVISAPASEWTDSRSSSAASSLSQPFDQNNIPMSLSQLPPSQWQPGQSVPVDYDQLNQEFQKVAQARQAPVEAPLSWSCPENESRRESATSLITQSLNNVGLHTPQPPQQPAKSPTPVSSLAARRQRQRPAPLGLTALRSQSYSSGAAQPLGSPGQMQPPGNTPPQLRRIKSSNIISGIAQGRVQKNMPPPQRSPLNWTFTDALTSPQLVRHHSTQSGSALAPPTPMSPPDNSSELIRAQQQWQNASKHINRQASISETDAEHAFAPAGPNFSSPPHTPMVYPHQQFLPPQIVPGNIMMENTPPQSAPALQQCFPQNVYGHSSQHMHQFQAPVVFQAQPMQQVFMPQPQQPHQMMNIIEQEPLQMGVLAPQLTVTTSRPGLEMPLQFAQNGLPIVDAQGQISLAMPHQLQFVQHKVPRSDSKQGIPAGSQTTFSVMSPETMPVQVTAQVPKNATQTPSDFFVHEYTPPQDIKRTLTPRKAVDTGPKNYTFANQTLEHFEKGKKSEKSSNNNSPDRAASA